MAAEKMDQARFEAIVEAYGADPRRWPEEEREAARAFAKNSGAVLDQARLIDALLDLAPEPTAPSDLMQARLARALPRRAFDWRPAAALAACAVFGLALGYGAGLGAPEGGDVEQLISAAFASPAEALMGEEL